MRKITTTLLAGLLGLGFGFAGALVPSEAAAVVFCAKNRNPSKVRVRGDVCRGSETEVSVLAIPEVESKLAALENRLNALSNQDHIYVVTRTHGPVGLLSTSVMCEDGDIATGGGVTSNQLGSSGPFVGLSGPVIDEFGKPIGWRLGISKVRSEIEIHVICAEVNERPSPRTTTVPRPTTTPPAISFQ